MVASLRSRIAGGQSPNVPLAVNLNASGDVTFTSTTEVGQTTDTTASLAVVNTTPGTFGSATLALTLTCDATGRILNVEETTMSASGLATPVTLSYTGDATGGPTTFDGRSDVSTALTLAASGVSAGTYGDASDVPVITFDAKGRATAASTVPIRPTALFAQTQIVAIANTVAETTAIGSGVGSVTIPANYFTAGRYLKITAQGFHSASGNPSIQARVYLGSTVILDTGVQTSGNSTDSIWELRGFIVCATTGVSGTVLAEGFYEEGGGGANLFGMVNTSAVTIDTTSSQVVNVTFQWGTASSGNSISAAILLIETNHP